MSRPLRIAVYGEINMNLIDGSSVWLQSVVETLAHVRGAEVVLLLAFPEERDLLTRSLHDSPGVEVVDPRSIGHTEPLSEIQAVGALEELDARDRFDLVLLRGSRVSEEACGSPSLAGRLWLYYLPPDGARKPDRAGLEVLAEGASRILCQTEAVRASVEAVVPGHAGKLILLPPMIPAPAAPAPPKGDPGAPRLVYAGKFAPEYRFLEMIELFEQVRERWPDARLDLVGDKIHDPADDPDFMPTAEHALRETRNLIWHGGLTRSETQELLRAADFGLAIRDAAMSHSLELSTKVLEYGAAGCAVVLNRTPAHEQLLGADYPLFVRQPADALDALLRVVEDPDLRSAAAERCERVSLGFTYERVAAGLEPYLPRPVDRPRAGRKLVIAGHDLKFATPLRAGLADYAEIEEDLWEGHSQHSRSRTRKLARWADTVLCEWCLGNAVWYSANKAAGQRLVIRFHRVELETGFPAQVEHEQVDAWVFVASHVLEEATRLFSLPAGKQVVIPNVVDLDRLLRPKLPDATFNLGMVGYVPSLKRADRALDILEALRASDPRFRLILKGKPPWEYPWVRRRDQERAYYQELYGRIARSPLLREAVSFEPFGPNVPAFLQKVRFLLSTSDIEGDQVAVAEAAGAAAIPVVLDRPGAVDLYPADWVHSSAELAAAAILRTVHAGETEAAGDAAVEFARGRWSLQSVIPLWADALALGGEPAMEPLRAS